MSKTRRQHTADRFNTFANEFGTPYLDEFGGGDADEATSEAAFENVRTKVLSGQMSLLDDRERDRLDADRSIEPNEEFCGRWEGPSIGRLLAEERESNRLEAEARAHIRERGIPQRAAEPRLTQAGDQQAFVDACLSKFESSYGQHDPGAIDAAVSKIAARDGSRPGMSVDEVVSLVGGEMNLRSK